jgi:hypothetical protein
MRPSQWNPAVALSAKEEQVVKRIRKAKLFVFLRQIRHELFDEEFQRELGTIYKDSSVGLSPVPPAQLALCIILQAYTGVSDEEAIEAMEMDKRWQLVLDCLEQESAPFGKGTLVRFRGLLMAKDFDRKLIEKTVEMAKQKGGYQGQALKGLRVTLDSSPLWGAARVEDTYNLLGHALRKALEVIAKEQQQDLATIAESANADILAGSSLKAALDLDWDDPEARRVALLSILQTLASVEAWVEQKTELSGATTKAVQQNLETAQQIVAQDVEQATEPGQEVTNDTPKLRRGVATNRRISIEDPDMRHGRKSRSVKVDGYKRHVLEDLDLHLIRAVGVTRANEPEAMVTADLSVDLQHQQAQLADMTELYIDRAYLASNWVRERPPGMQIVCKAWPVKNGTQFAKTAFVLDWDNHLLHCPNGISLPFTPGQVVRFPEADCQSCPLRSQCTNSKRGRTVSIHPDEALLAELREYQTTPTGRARLRQRVSVEHTLAHIGQWQGDQARYLGLRKNLFDLRRTAVVHNLHVLARLYYSGPTRAPSLASPSSA